MCSPLPTPDQHPHRFSWTEKNSAGIRRQFSSAWKGPANWLVNKSDFLNQGWSHVRTVTVRVPPATFYSPPPAPPSRDLGLALSNAPFPTCCCDFFGGGQGKGPPRNQTLARGRASLSPPLTPLPPTHTWESWLYMGKSSLTGTTWGSFPGTNLQSQERALSPVPSKEKNINLLRPSFSLDVCGVAQCT